MKKFLAKFALMGVLASSAWGITASPVQAKYSIMIAKGRGGYGRSCPAGSTYKTGYNFRDSRGKSVGGLFVYYSTVNGGTYCGVVRNTDGGTHRLKVRVTQDSANFALDYGDYQQYAGAVWVGGNAGRCTTIWGQYDNKPSKSFKFCGRPLY